MMQLPFTDGKLSVTTGHDGKHSLALANFSLLTRVLPDVAKDGNQTGKQHF